MDRVQFALEKQLKGAYDISKLKLSEQVTFRATCIFTCTLAASTASRLCFAPSENAHVARRRWSPCRLVATPSIAPSPASIAEESHRPSSSPMQAEQLSREKHAREDVGVQLYQVALPPVPDGPAKHPHEPPCCAHA